MLIIYKSSAELKSEVKESFRGRWKDVVLLNIIPSIIQIISGIIVFFLLAGIAVLTVFLASNYSSMTPTEQSEIISNWDSETDYYDYTTDDSTVAVAGTFVGTLFNIGSLLIRLVIAIIGTLIGFSIMFTFLEFVRNPSREIFPMKDSFRLFNMKDGVNIVVINFVAGIFQYFWSLLFVIPGIVKGFSYSQASFIYYDVMSNPNKTGQMKLTDYITESRLLMNGHKGRLFYIYLSFIGWGILATLTLGIGYLWLLPYRNATLAAFYNDIAKDRYSGEIIEEENQETEWTAF